MFLNNIDFLLFYLYNKLTKREEQMRIIHVADVHLDAPFSQLSRKKELGEKRRLEQRKALRKMIEYIKQEKIPYLLIAGDLYEHEYVRESTMYYINSLFQEIPDTKIYIAPGNHDPYCKDSYYATYEWSKNVTIFTSEKIEKIQEENINIYGCGFTSFYLQNSQIGNITLDEKEKINILLTHADLDASNIGEEVYQPITKKTIEKIGFDYVALGHIHKNNVQENTNIVYPGSAISLGFDELGQHGMVEIQIEKGNMQKKFIPLDDIELIKKEVSLQDIQSLEELVEKIEEIHIPANQYVEIILVGARNIEINLYKLEKLIQKENVIKIKDMTKIEYPLEQMQNETTLKGIFIKQMLKKKNEAKTEEEKQMIEKAIEVGLEVLK